MVDQYYKWFRWKDLDDIRVLQLCGHQRIDNLIEKISHRKMFKKGIETFCNEKEQVNILHILYGSIIFYFDYNIDIKPIHSFWNG